MREAEVSFAKLKAFEIQAVKLQSFHALTTGSFYAALNYVIKFTLYN